MSNLEKIWEETAKKAISASGKMKGKLNSFSIASNDLACVNCGRDEGSSNINLTKEIFFTSTVPTCNHVFCKRCLDTVFLLRTSKFNCPKCNASITEAKLVEKSPDEIYVDLDTYNRRKVKEIYNKKEEDFDNTEAGAEEYRAYEELIEDLIYNLNNGIDVEKTWAVINEHKAQNASTILAISERNNYEKTQFERLLVEQDEERRKKLIEFERQDALEEKRMREEAKLRNNAMLGDKVLYKSALDAATSGEYLNSKPTQQETQASIHATKPQDAKPNLAAILLYNKQPPRVIKGGAQTRPNTSKLDGRTERAMHIAGGYDYIQYTFRNWQEIMNGVGWMLDALDSSTEDMEVDTDQLVAQSVVKPNPRSWLVPWE